MKNILRFWCWRFYRSFFSREVLPFYTWFHPPSLDYDVSLHILVVLVVVIPTSTRTSKTEFVCKSYRNFRIAMFLSLGGADNPAPNGFLAKDFGGCHADAPRIIWSKGAG